jgi:hypothetical protein
MINASKAFFNLARDTFGNRFDGMDLTSNDLIRTIVIANALQTIPSISVKVL